MKRSHKISLVLLGGLSAGALTACAPGRREPPISAESYYPNDYYIAGAGYYHAPFHAFFPQHYNFYDPARQQYFYGGVWHPTPHESVINISTPTPQAASLAESAAAAIQRSGFGSTSRSNHIWS